MWRIEYYSLRIEQQVLAMPDGLLTRYIRLMDAIEKFGPGLGMPHTRAMGDGLLALRVKGKAGIARAIANLRDAHRVEAARLPNKAG